MLVFRRSVKLMSAVWKSLFPVRKGAADHLHGNGFAVFAPRRSSEMIWPRSFCRQRGPGVQEMLSRSRAARKKVRGTLAQSLSIRVEQVRRPRHSIPPDKALVVNSDIADGNVLKKGSERGGELRGRLDPFGRLSISSCRRFVAAPTPQANGPWRHRWRDGRVLETRAEHGVE